MLVEYKYDTKTTNAILRLELAIREVTSHIVSGLTEAGLPEKKIQQQLSNSHDLNLLKEKLTVIKATALPVRVIVNT